MIELKGKMVVGEGAGWMDGWVGWGGVEDGVMVVEGWEVGA